jgi:hypothetical protein
MLKHDLCDCTSFVSQQSQQQVVGFDIPGVPTLGFLSAVGEHPLALEAQREIHHHDLRLKCDLLVTQVPANLVDLGTISGLRVAASCSRTLRHATGDSARDHDRHDTYRPNPRLLSSAA